MRFILFTSIIFSVANHSVANTWSYQIKVNSDEKASTKLDNGKSSFEAGPHFCEVTPIALTDNTEYRSLSCSVGTGTVSTGALCTRKGHKYPSVQYAILNLYGAKDLVNVVVSCRFD